MTFKEFIETRRSKATQKTYSRVSRILGLDPDALAELARHDKRAAEDQIIRAIVGRRQGDVETPGRKLKASSIAVALAVLRSFFEYEDVTTVNWKRVRAVAPPAKWLPRVRRRVQRLPRGPEAHRREADSG